MGHPVSTSRAATILRWIARITGLLLVIFTLFIGIGEALDGRARHPGTTFLGQFTPVILATFAVWGVGLVDTLYTMLVFSIPSVLFLASWWMRSKEGGW